MQTQPMQGIAASPGDSIYGTVPSPVQPAAAMEVQSGAVPAEQYPVAQAIATEPVYAPTGTAAAVAQDTQNMPSAPIAQGAYELSLIHI